MTVPCTVPTSQLQLGSWDLLDPASPVVLATGWDRGAPVPTTSQIQASVLDGAAVVGVGAGNRSPSIPVTVHGTSRLDVAQIVNQLLTYVGQQTWTITFTPAGGFPVVFDCYRASWQVTSGIRQEDQAFAQSLTITCSALPYGRSPSPVTIPLAGSPLALAGFDTSSPNVTATATAGTVGALTYSPTPAPYAGSHFLNVPITRAASFEPIPRYSMDFTVHVASLSTVLADDVGSAHIALRQDGTAPSWNWTATLTVTAGGVDYTAEQALTVVPTSWRLFTFPFTTPIPSGATITAASIRLVTPTRLDWGTTSSSGPGHVYFDDLEVSPTGTVGVSDGQGVTAHLNGVQGSARAPLALTLSKVSANPVKYWCVHSAPAGSQAQPLIPLTAGTYTTDPAVRYEGVYDVWMYASTVANPTVPRTWTVGASQLTGGFGASGSVAASVSPTTGGGLVYLGTLALPLVDYPPESISTTTFTVTSSNGGDVFADVLLLDTRGQTIMVNDGNATYGDNVWIDEASPTVGLGGLYVGNAADRSDASSVAGYVTRAGVLFANPGDSTLLLFCADGDGTLQGVATYYPRWQQDATS